VPVVHGSLNTSCSCIISSYWHSALGDAAASPATIPATSVTGAAAADLSWPQSATSQLLLLLLLLPLLCQAAPQ